MEQSQSHLSRPAHDRLQEELKHRSGPLRLEISDRIERARELGDLKENADYDAAKNEQGLNEARVRQLEQMLRDVVIVEASDADAVGPGTITTLLFDGDDEPQEYLIGSIEERSDTYEVLSTSSPLGEALVGKKVDDQASYETPRGATVSVTVTAIRPAE
jgi:transcription elongation factor GreA